MINNKKRIGVSVYPAHQDMNEMKIYLKKAADLGYSRLFSSLLSVKKDKEILEKIKEILHYAKGLGYDTCLDVNPDVFKLMGLSPNNLEFFKEIGATTIRLDGGYDGWLESVMTFNPYNLNIEFNLSSSETYIDHLISHKPIKEKLIGCHNFYPQIYTGLEYQTFLKTAKKAKQHGLRTAAFISSQVGKCEARLPFCDGLPTLEMHRKMRATSQAKHLLVTDVIDDVIFGNAFASDEELKEIAQIDPNKLTFDIEFLSNASKIEKEIVLLDNHYRRGDINPYSARSCESRVTYKNCDFPSQNYSKDFKVGDIVICNNGFGKYKGELMLVLKDTPNDDRKNLIARVKDYDKFLLKYVNESLWFKFKEK